MSLFTLCLISKADETLYLELSPKKSEGSIADVIKQTSHHVFSDLSYSGRFLCEDLHAISNLQLYVNDTYVEIGSFSEDGSFIIQDPIYGSKIFTECYGFVRITVTYSYEGALHALESEHIRVMVPKGRRNDSVSRMAEFVYKHCEITGYHSTANPKDITQTRASSEKTPESAILLLQQIVRIFKENYRYFQANSKFTVEPKEYVDQFEKLRYISGGTIRYISQHPDQLQKTNTSGGIRIGKYGYQPRRTLVTDNVLTYDIYENRVIVGFLKTLVHQIGQMQKEMHSLVEGMPETPLETNEYISSSFFIYSATLTTIKKYISDLEQLDDEYRALLSAYSRILNVPSENVVSAPRPTAIFLSIPQYRQTFDCMVSWFSMGDYSPVRERYMLSFLRISNLYEVYVWTKLIYYFQESGFELMQSERKQYSSANRTLYKNTDHTNMYVFRKDGYTVTLYYQPIIYDTDSRSISDIGLYRNTSISFPKSLGDSSTGRFYTPDFLIKYTNEDTVGTKYLIADAKFSTLSSVKTYQLAALVYKYLFSISPLDMDDSIIGLCIINGQSDEDKDDIEDVYDRSITPGSIIPRAELLTLTENSTDNQKRHATLLREIFSPYLYV